MEEKEEGKRGKQVVQTRDAASDPAETAAGAPFKHKLS